MEDSQVMADTATANPEEQEHSATCRVERNGEAELEAASARIALLTTSLCNCRSDLWEAEKLMHRASRGLIDATSQLEQLSAEITRLQKLPGDDSFSIRMSTREEQIVKEKQKELDHANSRAQVSEARCEKLSDELNRLRRQYSLLQQEQEGRNEVSAARALQKIIGKRKRRAPICASTDQNDEASNDGNSNHSSDNHSEEDNGPNHEGQKTLPNTRARSIVDDAFDGHFEQGNPKPPAMSNNTYRDHSQTLSHDRLVIKPSNPCKIDTSQAECLLEGVMNKAASIMQRKNLKFNKAIPFLSHGMNYQRRCRKIRLKMVYDAMLQDPGAHECLQDKTNDAGNLMQHKHFMAYFSEYDPAWKDSGRDFVHTWCAQGVREAELQEGCLNNMLIQRSHRKVYVVQLLGSQSCDSQYKSQNSNTSNKQGPL